MRRAARIDANQNEIVEALRGVGASVEPIHFVGRGVPDILVGWRGVNHLLEIKDGSKPPSKRALTDDEKRWHQLWGGQVVIVETVDQALKAIGAI